MSESAAEMNFSELKPGMKARVRGFVNNCPTGWERLMDLGLVPGTEFEVIREAPLGDPVEICILGSSLCLRKCEGSCILVEKLSGKSEKKA